MAPTRAPTLSPVVQIYEYEGCYSGTTWESQRQADVGGGIIGVLACRDSCEAAGYTYFGMECPRGTSPNYVMHCECGNTLAGGSLATDNDCQQLSFGGSPCTGAPHYQAHHAEIGMYYLGAHSFNSAYKVAARNKMLF